MNPIDKEAYELAITIDPVTPSSVVASKPLRQGRELQGDRPRPRGFMPVRFARSHALVTSAEPRRQPFDVERATGNASGRRESAELLLRMKRLGISVWHPDPIKECERVEAARAKVASGGLNSRRLQPVPIRAR